MKEFQDENLYTREEDRKIIESKEPANTRAMDLIAGKQTGNSPG
jgi:hypothetical protein